MNPMWTILPLIFASCAIARELSFPKKAQVEVMIQDGKYEEAASEIEDAEIDSFWGNKLLEKVSYQRTKNSFSYSENHQPFCEEKITKHVLAGEVDPSALALYNIVTAPCPEISKKFIEKSSQKNLEDGTKKILDFVNSVVADQHKSASDDLDEGQKKTLDYLEQMKSSLQFLKEKLTSKSHAGDLERTISNISAISGQRQFFSSSDGKASLAMSAVCTNYREKVKLEALIADEKSKGKVSGYVNVLKLKTWGDELHDVRKQLNQSISSYEKLTKKNVTSFSNCD